MIRFRSIAFASLFALLAALAKACPFCSTLSNTLTENLAESEVAGLDPSAVRRAETMFPLVKRKATEDVREEAEDKK